MSAKFTVTEKRRLFLPPEPETGPRCKRRWNGARCRRRGEHDKHVFNEPGWYAELRRVQFVPVRFP